MNLKQPRKNLNSYRWPALLLVVLLFGLGTSSWATGTNKMESKAAEDLRSTWGIEIAGLRLSGQGYFVDFRYKVLDPEKAAPLADKEKKPYLIDEATGKQFAVPTTPKLGSLRQTAQKLKAGNVYFMFFSNRSGVLKPGSKVTFVVGDCRLEHLTIE